MNLEKRNRQEGAYDISSGSHYNRNLQRQANARTKRTFKDFERFLRFLLKKGSRAKTGGGTHQTIGGAHQTRGVRRHRKSRFQRNDFRHGLSEYMPGSKTKLLSDPNRLTPLRQKGRASLTDADEFLLKHLHARYGSAPFPRG